MLRCDDVRKALGNVSQKHLLHRAGKIRTQRDYLQHQKKLLAVFGKVKADVIEPEDVRQFMDRRGLQSKNQANQEISSMSCIYRWGYERGHVKGNPSAGVSKFSLKARDHRRRSSGNL